MVYYYADDRCDIILYKCKLERILSISAEIIQ